MSPERFIKIKEVLNRRQPDLTVITDNVHKPRNLSAIVRTCDAVGVPYVHSADPDGGYGTYHGTAKGSHSWVKVHLYEGVESPIKTLQAEGFKVYAATFTDRAVDYRELDYTQPCAILMGAEKFGVSDTAAELADEHIMIPMMGMVESFNVSVAAAIILSEAQRQRVDAGLYNESRMDVDEYQTTLFEWAQPKIAQYCKERHLEYPPLTEEGDIENPSEWYQSVRVIRDQVREKRQAVKAVISEAEARHEPLD